jgi:hypothetical protein
VSSKLSLLQKGDKPPETVVIALFQHVTFITFVFAKITPRLLWQLGRFDTANMWIILLK